MLGFARSPPTYGLFCQWAYAFLHHRQCVICRQNAPATRYRTYDPAQGRLFTSKEGSIAPKEGLITSKEGSITSKEGPITSKEGSITSKEGPITSKEGSITSKEGPITPKEDPTTLKESR